MTFSYNSTYEYGASKYVVSTDPASSFSTDLVACFNRVVALGGDTIYVQPGTYTFNGTFNALGTSMTIIGASTDKVDTANSPNLPSTTVVIIGNQAVTGTGSISFENITFRAAAGTAISATTGSDSSLSFTNCTMSNSAGPAFSFTGTDVTSFISINQSTLYGSTFGATLSNCTATFTNSSFSSTSAAALTIAANAQCTGNSNDISSSSGNALEIISTTGFLSSRNSSYTALSSGATCVNFTAAGQFRTINDEFSSSSPSTYWATTTNSSAGFIQVGNATLIGTATQINPILVPTYYKSSNVNGLNWNVITANQTLSVNNGYIVSSGALSLALPSTASVGDEIQVLLRNTGTSWTITQAAGQQIQLGFRTTTLGVGGSLTSSQIGDSVDLICVIANTTWVVKNSMGNITIV
jgi:hypothetical protein